MIKSKSLGMKIGLSLVIGAIVCVVFVKIYSRIAFAEARLWVAVLFIITFNCFNNYRGDIIRGYGFWAFTLLAINYYLSFYQAEKKINAIKWHFKNEKWHKIEKTAKMTTVLRCTK